MAQLKVQIVEDEGVVALDIRRHVESFGYRVSGSYASGEEAIANFEAEAPDLVLMDIRLQGQMDGIEAAQIIRDQFRVPVIILTAYADEKTIERAKFIEPFGYIIKPFEERELRTNIEMALFRHKLETRLQESEERYRRFFQEDLSADFVADSQGVLLACNRSFVEYFGFAGPEEVEGTPLDDRFPDETHAAYFWRQLQQNKRLVLHELDLLRADGTKLNLLANVVADSNENGEITEVKGYLIDISKRKNLEQQLRQAHKLEAIGRLAGGVAHDFNNILTVILGYSTIVQEKLQNNDAAIENEVVGIEDAAKRASTLTRQLLAFSRRQILKPKQVHLNELIKNLEKMMRRLVTEEVGMYLDLSAGPDTVWVDPGQIEQVMMNLIVNARDAMPGGGRITIRTLNYNVTSIEPSPMGEIPPGEYVCAAVRDTGVGIEPHMLKMIFEPFFTTKSEEKGTGLGLSTVYGIIKQSSGFLQIESEIGKGSTFWILLPISHNKSEAPKSSRGVEQSYTGTEKILVVEDEESLRNLVEKILKLYGYTVILADGAEQALKLLEANDTEFDLLVTDLVMPRMGGEELAERFVEQSPSTKIVYMSGYPHKHITKSRDSTEHQSTPFISKPFSPEEFVRVVREVLDDTYLG
jgi:two-component system, cell cycle sensor histidine kinase and response regulator CckA